MTRVNADMEVYLYRSCEESFPAVNFVTCLYHFFVAWLAHAVSHGLRSMFNKNGTFNSFWVSIQGIALAEVKKPETRRTILNMQFFNCSCEKCSAVILLLLPEVQCSLQCRAVLFL